MASSSAPKIIGRGGAGNFRDSDIPASETPATPDTRVVNKNSASVRSGRGGAGNINTSAPSPSTTSSDAGRADAGVVPGVIGEAPEAPKAKVGYGGRGGVGNWKVGAEEEERQKRAEEEERKRVVEEGVRRVVDGAGGLAAPGRAYRGVGREEEEVEEG